MTWAVGDWALDPKDGEVVEVLGERGGSVKGLYSALVIIAGRGATRGALAGERTLRRLDESYWRRIERGSALVSVRDGGSWRDAPWAPQPADSRGSPVVATNPATSADGRQPVTLSFNGVEVPPGKAVVLGPRGLQLVDIGAGSPGEKGGAS